MVTLFSYAREFAQFSNRVFLDAAPGTTPPASPWALCWEKEGGVNTPLHGGSDIMQIYPCLTVYSRPIGTQTPATARAQLVALMKAISDGIHAVDTHFDGITPYVGGSVQRLNHPAPQSDSNNPGGYYATLLLTALIHQK